MKVDRLKARAFFGELKRRNVLRAAALYAAAVWAFGQGLSQFSPAIGLPDWVTRWFLVACVIGFPFWLAFAWFYELTPTGMQRESQIAPDDSIAHSTGKKFDRWIIAVLVVAVVLLVTNQFVLRRDASSTANTADTKAIAAELAKVPNKSVAVLPLANEGDHTRQQYFVDGMSEDLISDLTQINGLKVIGKNSSFKFRHSKDSPAQIGAALGVAHLIQGSMSHEGESIRVTVSMIRAEDGSNVWSHSYDEQLKDVFAIQSKIVHAVASALKIQRPDNAIVADDKPPSGNVEAYQLMLQAHSLERHMTEPSFRQAIALTQQALKLDPNYAYAWGVLSNAWVNLGITSLTGDSQQQAYAQARVAADKEQALAPDAAATHVARGYLLSIVNNDPRAALTEYWRAYTLAPNDDHVMSLLAEGLFTVGQMRSAANLFRRVIATDPLRVDFYFNLANILLGERQLDAAEQVTRKALLLRPDFPGLYTILVEIDVLRGDAAAALRNANMATDPVLKVWALAAMAQIAPDPQQADAALHDYVAKNGKAQPYFVADLYALRKQPDQMFNWLRRAWTQRDPNLIGSLLNDPLVLAYQHDPRFAALCKQAGLPLPEQPLPAAARSSGH